MIETPESRPGQPDDPFDTLFDGVEARDRPPADIEQQVFRHFQQQWATRRTARTRRKRYTYFAMAASVLLVLLLQPMFNASRDLPALPGNLGQVEKFAGVVHIKESNRDFELSADMLPLQLSGGQVLDSGADSGVAIQWGQGDKSVRVDQNTVLKLISLTQIELVSGQVYLDIPGASPARSVGADPGKELMVVTRFGTVRHTGTQFVVAVDDEALEVKVREGSVAIDSGSQTHSAQAGVMGTLDDTGHFSYEPVAVYGPAWGWAEELAPAYEIEGRSVMDFLGWVQRETGKRCVYESRAAERLARETRIHGASLAMAPMQALDLVLQTNELSWNEQNGEILISLEH